MKTTNPDVRQQYEALLAHLPDGMSLAESEWKGNVVPKHFTVFCDLCRRGKAFSGSLMAFALPNVVARFTPVHAPACPHLLAETPPEITSTKPLKAMITNSTEYKQALKLLPDFEALTLRYPNSTFYRSQLENLREQLKQSNVDGTKDAFNEKANINQELVHRSAKACLMALTNQGLTGVEQNAVLEIVMSEMLDFWRGHIGKFEQERTEFDQSRGEVERHQRVVEGLPFYRLATELEKTRGAV